MSLSSAPVCGCRRQPTRVAGNRPGPMSSRERVSIGIDRLSRVRTGVRNRPNRRRHRPPWGHRLRRRQARRPQPPRPPCRPNPPAGRPTSELERSLVDAIVPLTGVGALLSAGLLTGLAWRRRVQLQTRPIGRRILHPPDTTRPIEVELGRRQRPMSLRTLDQALRAISAHCRSTGAVPPPLQIALVGDDRLELIMREPSSEAPPGFEMQGRSWTLSQADAGLLDLDARLRRRHRDRGRRWSRWAAMITIDWCWPIWRRSASSSCRRRPAWTLPRSSPPWPLNCPSHRGPTK